VKNPDEQREVNQLLNVAKHYMQLAETCLTSDSSLAGKKLEDVTKEAESNAASNPSQLTTAEIVLAHFASAAVRLCTICEIIYGQNARKELSYGKYYRNS